MSALDYLRSLIAGQTISEIPVQMSELKFLETLLLSEQK